MNLRKISVMIIVGIVLASILLGCGPADSEEFGPVQSVNSTEMKPTLPMIDQGRVPDFGSNMLTAYCWRNHKVYVLNGYREDSFQVFENHKDCENK